MLKTYAGTPLNMAPEILKGCFYNEKVDVYSAGTVLYEMLFGVCPYQARDKEVLLSRIERGRLEESQHQNVVVSENVQHLLQEMLQPEPERRIDLSEILDFIQTYEAQKREERILIYRRMSMKSKGSIGVMGSLAGCFDF